MGSLFSPKVPQQQSPKKVRMPSEQDPEVLDAAARTRADVARRGGFASTILSENLQKTAGSSGQKLGA
jgi:hypothetical protein